MHLEAVPLTQKKANELVEGMHRHHPPVRGDIFQIGAVDETEKLVGVIQVGRPVSRILDDGKTCEVTRLCTDGTRNACSFLYAKLQLLYDGIMQNPEGYKWIHKAMQRWGELISEEARLIAAVKKNDGQRYKDLPDAK